MIASRRSWGNDTATTGSCCGRTVGTLVAGLALALAAPAAHAGSSIFTGAVNVVAGQDYQCSAINVSPTKTLTNVTITVRSLVGTNGGTGGCSAVGPREVCPVELSAGNSDEVYCEVTSDQGAKLLRLTLSNKTTGASSDAR